MHTPVEDDSQSANRICMSTMTASTDQKQKGHLHDWGPGATDRKRGCSVSVLQCDRQVFPTLRFTQLDCCCRKWCLTGAMGVWAPKQQRSCCEAILMVEKLSAGQLCFTTRAEEP